MKNLSAKEFKSLLHKLDACEEASIWAKGKDLAEVWKTCHRGDWMLWLAARYGDVPLKILVRIVVECAESVLCNVPKTETRPAKCLATVRRWLNDKASIDEVRSAAESAQSAAESEWSAAWSARSAESPTWSVRSVRSAELAAWSAAESAAAWSARSAAWSAQSAAQSARSAAESAWSAQSARSAAESARSAAQSAWSAESAARSANLLFSADLCRKYIRVETL